MAAQQAAAAATTKVWRQLATAGSSGSLEEARHRGLELFREVCRALPDVMFRYNLDELITRQELRSRIADEFRRQSRSANPKVLDVQVYKAREELLNYLTQSKQRHHVISRWVVGPQGQVPTPSLGHKAIQPGIVAKGHESEFLLNFYAGNQNV